MSLRPETIKDEPSCSCGHPGLHPEWHMKGCEWLKWSKRPAPEGLPPDPLGPWTQSDEVHSPRHYTRGKVEVIEITEDLNFCLGNAVKYILRCDYKGNPIQDLEKAAWYIQREIERRKNVVD